MNIALIETHAIPGVWKYDICLAGEIAALGHTVTIVTSRAFPEIGDVPPGVRILRIFPNLQAHSSYVVKGVLYLIATLRSILLTRRGGFDVIHWQHFNTFPPAETVMALAYRMQRPRLVMTVHDVDAWSTVRAQFAALLRKTYRSADRIIVHHAANVGDLAKNHAIPAERIDVVPHGSYSGFAGALPERAASRDALDIPADGRVVLFFGEIRPEKGLIHLIRSMGALRDAVPDLCLVIAGRPRHMDMGDCMRAIDDLGIGPNVICRLEYIADDDVQRYFAAADVVAIPYVAITQSGILFEAMTAGRPVVASDVGGVGPTVREKDVGLVVPPADEAALAEAIGDLLADDATRERMGRNGLRESATEYSWARCAADTRSVYERAIEDAAGA
ncbi:MAG: glycosyltransferase family 4 protein [Proteobacteria bacterium]|nr:glycosyltransferase family 4 protein [Pseudomonadota bacterium]